MRVNKGDLIVKEGTTEKLVFYIIDGYVELKKGDIIVGHLTEGSFIGELIDDVNLSENVKNDNENKDIFTNLFEKDKNRLNKWQHTIIAKENCKLLVWKTNELHKYLSSNKRLIEASIKVMYADMKLKLDLNKRFNIIKSYDDILKVVTHDDVLKLETKKRLEKYRQENNISDKTHQKALEKIGWTLEDYDNGKKAYKPYWEIFIDKLGDWYSDKRTSIYKNEQE